VKFDSIPEKLYKRIGADWGGLENMVADYIHYIPLAQHSTINLVGWYLFTAFITHYLTVVENLIRVAENQEIDVLIAI